MYTIIHEMSDNASQSLSRLVPFDAIVGAALCVCEVAARTARAPRSRGMPSIVFIQQATAHTGHGKYIGQGPILMLAPPTTK